MRNPGACETLGRLGALGLKVTWCPTVPYLVSIGTRSSQKTIEGRTVTCSSGLGLNIPFGPPSGFACHSLLDPPSLSRSAGSLRKKAPGVGVLELLLGAAREPVLQRPHPQNTASAPPSAALAAPAELERGASAAWDQPHTHLPPPAPSSKAHSPLFLLLCVRVLLGHTWLSKQAMCLLLAARDPGK